MAMEENLLLGASLAVIWEDCDKDKDNVLGTKELSYFIKQYMYIPKREKDTENRTLQEPTYLQHIQNELSEPEDLALARQIDSLLKSFGRDPQPLLFKVREIYGHGRSESLSKEHFMGRVNNVMSVILKIASDRDTEEEDSSESLELTQQEMEEMRQKVYGGEPRKSKAVANAPARMNNIASGRKSKASNTRASFLRPRNSTRYVPQPEKKSSSKSRSQKKRKRKKGQRYFPEDELQGKYEFVKYLGHGSYGHVCEARNLYDNSRVALKKVDKIFGNKIDAKRFLREIYILRLMKNHEAIVDLIDILPPPRNHFGDFDTLYLVFEYVDTDLHHLIGTNQFFSPLHCKYMLYQVVLALHFMHSGGMVHRDIKPANILINEDCSVKLCDFGLARGFNESEIAPTPKTHLLKKSGNLLNIPGQIIQNVQQTGEEAEAGGKQTEEITLKRDLTRHIVTRWYRAPEVILITQDRNYLNAIDMWSIGCIMSELVQMVQENVPNPEDRSPLFPGKSCFPLSAKDPFAYQDRMDQLNMIFEVIGTPPDQIIEECCNDQCQRYLKSLTKRSKMDLRDRFSGLSSEGVDLLAKLLNFDYRERCTAAEALEHPYFADVRDPDAEARHSQETFDFEDLEIEMSTLRELIFDEIIHYNAQLNKRNSTYMYVATN